MRCARLSSGLCAAVAAVAALCAVAGVLGAGGTVALAQATPHSIAVAPRAGSGVSGTATLADLGGRTWVEVRLTPAGGDHPMHFHEGPCASANPAPKYALANVQNGASATEMGIAISELTRAPMSILVHRSAQDIDTVIACADVVLPVVAGLSVLPAGGIADSSTSAGRGAAALALLAVGGLGLFVRRLGRRSA